MRVKAPWTDVDLEVDGYYEPAEKGSYEGGVQMEPDYSAYFVVESVKLADVELIDVLQDSTVEQIEELACSAYEEGVRDAREEARISQLDL